MLFPQSVVQVRYTLPAIYVIPTISRAGQIYPACNVCYSYNQSCRSDIPCLQCMLFLQSVVQVRYTLPAMYVIPTISLAVKIYPACNVCQPHNQSHTCFTYKSCVTLNMYSLARYIPSTICVISIGSHQMFPMWIMLYISFTPVISCL